MKKMISLLLSGFISVSALSGCFLQDFLGGSSLESAESLEESAHTHNFGMWIVTDEPTCQKEGNQTRVCACGEEEHFVLNKEDHAYGLDGRCVWCDVADEDLSEGGRLTRRLTRKRNPNRSRLRRLR